MTTRILVVEDENFIAMELAWIVEDAGCSVVGLERSVEETRQVLASKVVDLALLDVNLGGELVSRYRRCWTRWGFRSSSSRAIPHCSPRSTGAGH